MQTQNLKKMESFEGLRLDAYLDPVGIPTIGYGHTAGVKMGTKITQEQAEKYLAEDLKKAEKAVDALKLSLNPNQRDALASFTYNCGAGNLAKLCANRTLSQIADAIMLYNKAGGQVLLGLTRRRTWERELFLTPVNLKPLEQVAIEVLDNKYGTGTARKNALEAAGYDYKAVQEIVNRLVKEREVK